MQRSVIFFVIVLPIIFSQSAGELVMKPRSTESKVDETTYFNCSTSLEDRAIFWYHGNKYVYTTAGILDPYRERFKVDWNASVGSYNLVIHSVESGDAGEYICVDDDGLGTRQSAELVVLDTDPDCQSNIQPDGVIGQNVFNIPTDEVQLTCTVTYHGNVPPRMDWMKGGENKSIKENVTSIITSNNRVMYTLKFRGDIVLHNSSYVCQTTRSTQNQYKCISEIIKVLYFVAGNTTEQNVVRGEKITCFARNVTFPCTSQWYHDNYTCPLSCDETITTHLLGEYLCKVKCHVRGTDYYFQALKAFVVEMATTPPHSTAVTVSVAILMTIVCIIGLLAVLISILAVRRNKRKYATKKDDLNRIKSQQIDFQLAGITFFKTGEPKTTNGSKVYYKDDPVLVKTIRTKAAQMNKTGISGLAIVDTELFMTSFLTNDIEVYDLKSLNLIRSWKLLPLINPYDLGYCNVNKCLYLMDLAYRDTSKAILGVDRNGKLLKCWTTKMAYGCISVTYDCNVLMAEYEGNTITEYTADGKIVRKITLSTQAGFAHPRQAIKLTNDRFLMSHGVNYPLHRVCVVDSSGNILKSFGGQSGSTPDQLYVPIYLAIDSNGSIFVVDRENNRVLMFSSGLELTREIISKKKEGMLRPERLILDQANGRLLVACNDRSWSKCRVLVFDIL